MWFVGFCGGFRGWCMSSNLPPPASEGLPLLARGSWTGLMTGTTTPAPNDSSVSPSRSNAIGSVWQSCIDVARDSKYGHRLSPLQHLVLTLTAEAVLVPTTSVRASHRLHLGCSSCFLVLCLRLLGHWIVRCPCCLSLGYWLCPQPLRSPVRSSDEY